MSLNGAVSHANVSGKQLAEDVLDLITLISPDDTPLFSNLGEGQKPTQKIHQWLNDEIARSTSSGAVAEAADFSYSVSTQPSRSTNYVQEIARTFRVSWANRESKMYGMEDPYEYEKSKAMRRAKFDAEWSMIWGTGLSGLSGTGWEMTGLKKAISTNFTSYASGTSLTENRFNDLLQLAYDDIDDSTFQVYTSIGLKRAISEFTGGVTKNIDADENRLVKKIDVYESDVFSRVEIYKHRDISDANMLLIGLQPNYFKKAIMDNFAHREIPSLGAYDSGVIYGSMTLEFRQEKAGIRGEGLVR